ncbi:cyclin L [Martensiomyces pterosporus]|nr:cyclin L [Martensiomyces pterosporus]
MARELESDMRAYGCHLIEATGIVLRVPQVVMASAQILFQRFYHLASFQDFPMRGTVLGILFLACKVEESPQSIRNIINVLDIVIKRDRGYPEIVTDGYDAEYYDLKNEMVIAEMQILRRLGFNVQVELPYGLLVNYLRSLDLTRHPRIPQLAWNYLNDLLRTPIYTCFQPETIACGAIYLAAHECNVPLPTSPPWWEIFDANGGDVAQVARAIRALYMRTLPRIMPLDAEELNMHLDRVLHKHIEDTCKDRWAKAKSTEGGETQHSPALADEPAKEPEAAEIKIAPAASPGTAETIAANSGQREAQIARSSGMESGPRSDIQSRHGQHSRSNSRRRPRPKSRSRSRSSSRSRSRSRHRHRRTRSPSASSSRERRGHRHRGYRDGCSYEAGRDHRYRSHRRRR